MNFYNLIKESKSEAEVADRYKEQLKKNINFKKIEYLHNSDGYLEGTIKYDKSNHIIKLLMEFKKDKNFLEKKDKCEVILQALYYIRSFIIKAVDSPEVLLIGDKNACFIISIKDIIHYLDKEIDWTLPASSAYKNTEIINEMIEDENINPFVFIINETFKFEDVIIEIEKMAKNLERFINVCEENILLAFDYFTTTVISNSCVYKADEIVQIFISILKDSDNCIVNNKNVLITPQGKRIPINGKNFESYFSHFKLKYKPSEIRELIAISDRLIEDSYRRIKGEYYTPTTWVNIAHERISKVFGANWKEEYVVWDCAWGTGNLTRDYKFKQLYCSTLDDEDLKIGEEYNKEAKKKFQYDFLNDDINEMIGQLGYSDIKMPKELLNDLESNKKILFFINPPFGSAGSGGAKGTSKKDISKSQVKKLMKDREIGTSSKELYAQFIYKIILIKERYGLTNVNLCFFSTPTFLTGQSFKKFRNIFFRHFCFKDGFLFKASNFAAVKDTWGISFSIWSSENSENPSMFKYDVLDYIDGEIKSISKKSFYNTDTEVSCSSWIREETKKMKTYDAPQFKTAISIKEKGSGRIVENSLGYLVNSSNCIDENNTYVLITSEACCKGHGVSITKDNFMKIVSNYAARKLITGKYCTWINNRDEYIKPNTEHMKYHEWNNDAIIYSIFSKGSQQGSLRNVLYKNKTYKIKNNFFFESRDTIKKYADDNYNNECYDDALAEEGNTFVYELLNRITLSVEATEVINYAKFILEESFKYRKDFNNNNPEYQINNWDCGWYQIKRLLNYSRKDLLKEFNKKFEVLENKMRPMIYELGFLKK